MAMAKRRGIAKMSRQDGQHVTDVISIHKRIRRQGLSARHTMSHIATMLMLCFDYAMLLPLLLPFRHVDAGAMAARERRRGDARRH